MGKFANYDVRRWLDGVLSRHPESYDMDGEAGLHSRAVTNPAYSLILAASVAMLPSISAADVSHHHNTSMPSQSSLAHDAVAGKVFWIEAAQNPEPDSVVAGFESYFKEIQAQVKSGGLLGVPTEMRSAARLALTRTAPDDWMEKLASDLSKLKD